MVAVLTVPKNFMQGHVSHSHILPDRMGRSAPNLQRYSYVAQL